MDVNSIELSVQDVIDAYGEHYINEGQNMSNLHMLPFEEFGTQSAGTMIETNQTVLREANVSVQEIVQQYQDDFTSKGGVGFKPVMIPLYNVKIDVALIPHKLIKTWLGFLTTNSRTPEDYPFVAWLIQEYLLKQTNQDLELQAIYNGIYEAAEEGVAGSANKVMNGIQKLLVDLEAANELEFINTGAINATPKDFVTQVESMIRSIPEKYRYNYELELNMSRNMRDNFKQGMRDKYNINYQQTNQLLQVMDFENVSVVGRASMTGKSRIWTTPKFNLLMPVKGFSNKDGFELQKFGRYLKLLTDWWMGAGFVQPELIWTNELT